MPAPKGKGIADDSSDYEDLMPSADAPRAPAKSTTSEAIADDASLFTDLVDESTDKARTLDSDWLYKVNGQVFGPVKPRDLLELLYDGQISRSTEIAIDGAEFAPLERYGVFRVHLPKVEKRKAEVAAASAAEEAAAKERFKRRAVWVVAMVLVAGLVTTAIVAYIRSGKEDMARAEARQKEEALLREVDSLMASVTIEPPLAELVDDDDEKRPVVGKKKPRRAVAKFGGASEVAGAGGTGDLTRSEIMSGIGRVFPGFKRCIVEQIQRDSESVPEQIILTFVVQNDGRTKEFSLADRGLRQTPLKTCMGKQIDEIRFRKFKGEVKNVEYPITIGR